LLTGLYSTILPTANTTAFIRLTDAARFWAGANFASGIWGCQGLRERNCGNKSIYLPRNV